MKQAATSGPQTTSPRQTPAGAAVAVREKWRTSRIPGARKFFIASFRSGENQPRLSITGCVRAVQLMHDRSFNQNRPGLLWPIDRGINTHKAHTGPAHGHISLRQLTSGCLGLHATLPQHALAAPDAFFVPFITSSFCHFAHSFALTHLTRASMSQCMFAVIHSFPVYLVFVLQDLKRNNSES